MERNCRSCGAALPEGAGRCPACLAIVKPPGFFQRLFEGLKVNVSVNRNPASPGTSGISIKTTVHRSFKFHDARTGETKEYHSLEEVPEQYRQKISQAMAGRDQSNRSGKISYLGPDGVRHTYNSLDDVPASVRKLIEDAKQIPGTSGTERGGKG